MADEKTQGGLESALQEAVPDEQAVAANGHAAPRVDVPEPLRSVAIPFPDGPLFDVMQMPDLGMADAEQFRRLWLKLIELRGQPGDDDGLLSDAQMARIADIELKLCLIAVPEAPREDVRALSGRRRAALVYSFLEGLGITRRLQAAVQRATEQQAQATPTEAPEPAAQPTTTRSKRKSAATTKRPPN